MSLVVNKDTGDQIRLRRYGTLQVLTLLKITVKPALFPITGQTKMRSFRRGIGISEEAECLELFDLPARYSMASPTCCMTMRAEELGAPMGVVRFDAKDVFPQREFAEDLVCDDGVPIQSHGKCLARLREKRVLLKYARA